MSKEERPNWEDDHTRIAGLYRDANRRTLGALMLRSRSLQGIAMGNFLLSLIVAIPLESVAFRRQGWLGWPARLLTTHTWMPHVSGSVVLVLLGIAMVLQASWLCLRSGPHREASSVMRRSLEWAAAGIPVLGLTYVALRRFQRLPRRDRDISSVLPISIFERSEVVKGSMILSLVSALLGVSWMSQVPDHGGWRIVPVVLLLVASHGSAVVCLDIYLTVWFRERALARGPAFLRRGLASWAWLPAPVAIGLFAVWLGNETRLQNPLMTHQCRLGSSSVRRGTPVRQHGTRRLAGAGSTRRQEMLGSFTRLQSFRLFCEGMVLGCLIASWLSIGTSTARAVAIGWVLGIPIFSFVSAIRWTAERIHARYPLLRSLRVMTASLRTLVAVGCLTLGLAVGADLSAPWDLRVLELLGPSLKLAIVPVSIATIFGFTSTSGQSHLSLVLWLGLIGLLALGVSVREIPMQFLFSGYSFAQVLAILVGWMAALGPAMAVAFLPWLLKPDRWQEVYDTTVSARRRLRILVKCCTAVLPLSGLLIPVWQAALDSAAEGSTSADLGAESG